MTHLVPIKVKIFLKENNQHLFPDFNTLPAVLRGGDAEWTAPFDKKSKDPDVLAKQGIDWSYFFDREGIGWHYDKLSGHGEIDQSVVDGDIHVNDDSTCWHGALCVPADFADAAIAMFPDTVKILSEIEWERFFDDRSHVLESAEIEDREVLQKLELIVQAEKAATPPIIPNASVKKRRAEMLDPDHPRQGVRKNHNRFWEDYKVRRGVQIRAAEAKP